MKIKIDHVNISVNNLIETLEWYEKVFGFKKATGGINQHGQAWVIIANNDNMIAISEYPERQNPVNHHLNDNAHRIYHFGIRVDNLKEWQAKIKEHRLKLYYGGEVTYPHSTSWYVQDPTGHEIEVSYSNNEPLKFN